MTQPTFLDHLFANVLVRIELASGVKAVRYSAGEMGTTITIGKSGEGQAPPPCDAPHLFYKARYAGCTNDEQRKAVFLDAYAAWNSIRYSPKFVDPKTLEGRLKIGRDPHAARIVAGIYGCSERHVYRCRAEARRLDERKAA